MKCSTLESIDVDMTPSAIDFRYAEPRDRAIVSQLGTSAFSGFGTYRKTIEYWFSHAETKVLLACEGTDVIGFIMFGARGLIKEHGDTVLALAVESEHQRKGIGTTLLEAALRALATTEGRLEVPCHLDVGENNIDARRLFNRLGFIQTGQDSVYPSGSQAIGLILPAGIRVEDGHRQRHRR